MTAIDTGAPQAGQAGHAAGAAAGAAPGPAAFVPLTVPGPWRSVGHRLEHLAAALPDRPAIASTDQIYTYRELLDTAEGWARSVAARLADEPPARPVGLRIEPDARGTVALIAVALSGHPVVPLDPMLPQQRIEAILAASGAVEMTAGEIAALPAVAADIRRPAEPDDIAVVFYTSGSTGTPKGLAHSHAAWLNQAYDAGLAMDLRPQDRVALILPLSFGGGLDVLFMSVLNGCSAHVRDPRVEGIGGLAAWLRDQRVSTVHATPSLLRALLDTLPPDGVLAGVRLVTTCGEAIHSSTVLRLRRHMEPGSTYSGLSGASEIGTLAHMPLPWGAEVPSGIIPVGFPAANKTIRVLDEDGRALGPGVTGEVAITSRYLSSGYFGNPELTRERMAIEPDGQVTYRGGDLGQWDEHGRLHLRGRADAAMKVGGYLVEPAEVEGALLGLPHITEAVVGPVTETGPDGQPRTRIAAYVVPAQTDKPVTPASIRRALRDVLPSWMVPSRITLLTQLPRNERGKVDRTALAESPGPTGRTAPPGSAGAAETQRIEPPRTPTEHVLSGLWSSVLGIADIGRDADFWELGADSLSVEEMLAGASATFGVALSMADLSDAPTVATLAAAVDSRLSATRGRDAGRTALPPTAVRLRRGPASASASPTVFAFAGGGASALSLLPIAKDLACDVPVFGFHASGYAARGRSDWRLRDVVRRHRAVIDAVAPSGPTVLVGHSYGGLLAIETARGLAAEGRAPELVVLLDTRLPDALVTAATGGPAPGAPELQGIPAPGRRERLAMHLRVLTAGLIGHPPELRDAVFWEQSARLVRRHRLGSWNGRTLLFTVADNPDQRAWWEQVLTGDVEMLPIDGGHSSILRAPFHRPIVERLGAELNAVAARS